MAQAANYGTVGYVSRTTDAAILKLAQELSLGKKYSRSGSPPVSSTPRGPVAGAERSSRLGCRARHRRAHHHAAAARRLSQAGQPVVVGARTARPGAGGAPRNRRLRDLGHQAGMGFLLRLSARPVRRDRGVGRRALALAVVLADFEPGDGGSRTITITVKAMPEGFLSTHLVGGVAPGTIVRLAAPQGNFVMPDPAPASVLFITAGSGITPVMSMLRTLARRDQVADMVHLHSAPTESDVMFASELARARPMHDGLPAAAAGHPHRRPAGSVAGWRRGARLARAPDLGVRARGHAHRRRAGLVGARHRRPAPSRALRGVARPQAHGAGRHGQFERSQKTRDRRRRDLADGRG